MKRITAFKLTLIYLVISTCTILALYFKNHQLKDWLAESDAGTNFGRAIYVLISIVSALLAGKFLPIYIIKGLLRNQSFRRYILRDLNVEGFWFVEWLTIDETQPMCTNCKTAASSDSKDAVSSHKAGECVGYELVEFRFTWDLEYLEEKAVHFAEDRTKTDASQETDQEMFCNGRCQLTNSTYQIHISDDKKYISSFDYNEGKYCKRGVSKVEFLIAPGGKKPVHYEGIIMGFEDNYREMHVGRPIDKETIDYFKRDSTNEHGYEWARNLLRNKGVKPESQPVSENQAD